MKLSEEYRRKCDNRLRGILPEIKRFTDHDWAVTSGSG